jgi:hypothetical protein
MGGDSSVKWATCREDDCLGIRLRTGDRCLAHADSQDRDAELKRFGEEGTLDARGVRISAELLNRILDAGPLHEDRPQPHHLGKVRFDGATFGDHARFDDATFGLSIETARRMDPITQPPPEQYGEAPHGTEEIEAASSAAFLRASPASRGMRSRS